MTVAIESHRFAFVTGKGGVGKTTVAAALGIAAARAGRRVVVCEVGHQRRLPRLFGLSEDHADGEEIALADGLWTVSVDPDRALREWLARQLGSRQLSAVLTRSNLFGYFVAAAPGARELVTVTKLWELGQAERWRRGARHYDLVVADLPASGHGTALLRTARTFAEIARVGPIGSQAGRVADAIEDRSLSALLAVALPGELPVTETLELEAAMPAVLRRPVDAIVANGVLGRRFAPAEVEQVLAQDGSVPTVARRAVRLEADRVRSQQRQLARLRRGAVAPVSTLPFVPAAGLGVDEVADLGALLIERLAAG